MKAKRGPRKSSKKEKKKPLLLSNASDAEIDKIFDTLAKSEASLVGGEKTNLGSVSAQNIAQESICLGLEIDMELAQSMIECMCSKMNIEYHQNKTISREEFKNLVKILTKENA